MRQLLMVVSALFLAALILAQPGTMAGIPKTHDLAATVVSVDLQAKKITFQDAAGATTTASVLDKAVDSLKTIKPAEKVVLTCRDNEKGEHEGVIAIRAAEATSTPDR